MPSRQNHSAATERVNPRHRFYVKSGLSFESPWVAIDRQVDAVVAEFVSRSAARDYVKARNGG